MTGSFQLKMNCNLYLSKQAQEIVKNKTFNQTKFNKNLAHSTTVHEIICTVFHLMTSFVNHRKSTLSRVIKTIGLINNFNNLFLQSH